MGQGWTTHVPKKTLHSVSIPRLDLCRCVKRKSQARGTIEARGDGWVRVQQHSTDSLEIQKSQGAKLAKSPRPQNLPIVSNAMIQKSQGAKLARKIGLNWS
jgi:hypothetical protein